jgi:hypothetical protein
MVFSRDVSELRDRVIAATALALKLTLTRDGEIRNAGIRSIW